MSFSETIKEDLAYAHELLASGLAGAKEARKTVLESKEKLAAAAQKSWQGSSIGVLAGAILGALADDREPLRGGIAGGLLGAGVGFAAIFAWKTRPLASAVAHEAGKRIGMVRDQHWLSKHPVNYG